MGSGGTPIKFGPEWLRNLGEGTTQSGAPSSGSGASESTSGTAGTGRNNLQTTGSPLPGSTTAQNLRQNNTSRIHLANLRYGREEMLALYDRLVAAPESIKQFELLYQQRGKPPCALNVFKDGQNTPEEGASGGQIGGTSLSSYSGRGRGNGVGTAYTKKPSTVRPNVTNMGRVWNKVRTDPAQGGSVPPDTQELRRSWNASNAAGTSRQATTEQSGWASTKLFKNRRQIRSTNWRQSGREEGGEWRSQDHAARFPNAERDWPERSPQDRPQSWSANRRPWSEHQNDEIPEWANDNADAGAGTFDSSGAFHGCSDEVRPQEQTFPLPRYQASSNLMRSSSDEAAEQWWSSEKAKKLSPKRLISGGAQGQASTSNDASQDTPPTNNEQLEVRMPEPKPENDVKPKPFDALLRRDIDVGNENNNLSNFQSVMISQNNTLRQKHQNIVSSPTTGTNNQSRNSFPIFQGKYEQMKQITAEQGNGNQENLFEGPLPDNMPIKNPTPNIPRAPSEDTSVLTPGQQGGPPNLQLQTGGAVAGIEAQSIPSATKIPNPVQNSIPPLGLQNSASGTTLNMQSNDLMMPPLHGLPQMMSSTAFNPGMSMPSLQQRSNMMDAFQQNVRSHIMTSSNAPSASVPYLGQNNAMMASNRQPNPEMAACMFPPQGIPRHAAQPPPLNSVYGGPSMLSEAQNFLADLWYYEDPEKKIQGPFSSKEMWNWYIAGYFQPSLIVRRAFETTMRPLADYGPMPFLKVGMNSQVNCPRAPDTINPQAGFGLGETSRVWSPAPHSQNIIWMEPTLYPESSVNNLPRYFWDVEPPAMPSIVPKEMKTEDEILAQILSSQNISLPRAPSSEEIVKPVPLSNVHSMNANNVFVKPPNVPDLSQLPVIRPEMIPRYSPPTVDIKQQLEELAAKQVPLEADAESPKASSPKEVKTPKLNKNESEKCKNKEANGKSKSKKPKEEKKDDNGTTTDDDATKQLGKRSVESSPSKTSKEVKVPNKKDLEKEKKELMKDGFTIVKGAEKNNNKEIKKKVEEAKAAEEAARKKKEEDAMLEADESRKLSLAAVIKKQDQQKQAAEFVAKKAPWSAVATQATATDKGALTLAVIQRLEREKKLEQIKEQQQMMQIIAQQQAATLAREQEVQAGLGWATKKNATPTTPPNLAEIQSKTRRQQAAATPVASEFPDEKSQAPPAVVNHVPWGTSSNGGFWDSPSQSKQNADPVKSEPSKPVETKSKSKTPVPAPAPSKKKATPAMEFDSWCTQALGMWTSKIDVPTFMVFLKDIESPYEVKDYVKCYLGESKESSDFSRQFLERRSKLLRVGTVTPSDDLCSPALAINPRNNSTSDYQEVKGKGKKTKKNKMMKVDARILGFSVTAAEDRINVGDIDTA